ncbi:MAG: DEAD/DEAH box helicase [Acidobacteriota bacterium]
MCRMHQRARIPRWIHDSAFYSATRTPDELALIAETRLVPSGVKHLAGWRAIRVLGTLDPKLIGVQAALTVPLAEAGIPALTLSTFDADYCFVRGEQLDDAVARLSAAGHVFEAASSAEDKPADEARSEDPAREQPAATEQPADIASGSVAETAAEPTAEPPAAATDEAVAEAPPAAEIETQTVAVPVVDTVADAVADRAADSVAAETTTAPADAAPLEIVSSEAVSSEAASSETLQPNAQPAAPDTRPDNEPPALEGDESEGLYTGAIPQDPVETTEDTFESLGLSPRMVDTLQTIGFLHPTPIQAAVIPMALEGSDILGLAETGSGKTGAFGLPLAERLHHGGGLRGLVLSPTREIALQTKAFLDTFGRDHDLETAVIIGGVKFGPQIDALRRRPDIIVATPGRLADHMRRGNVKLHHLEELVLDEADHMLDLGFLPQIQEILQQVPDDRRTMMFSATMPAPIERLAQRFLNDPYMADLRPVNRVAAGIEHRLYLVNAGDEKRCLIQLLKEEDGTTLVFARRKLDTEWLARQLELAGLPVDRIHSDRTQAQRVRALRGFREGKTRILVATDVAARGIDVPRLAHVINYELPENVEDYVHRAGRTARGKAVGTVSSIGTWQNKVTIREIERTLGEPIPRCEVAGVEAYKELKPRKRLRRRLL